MNKARLIITAIHVENLTQQEAAKRYGVSQSWVSKLITWFNLEGKAGLGDSTRTKTNRSSCCAETSPPSPRLGRS
ncbi:sigma factor-like helix-turn-helix DNA-binding protein [Pontimonas salivibrio]|uniref:sigma factor-like helix-turn-helix DNA-binding protein n=1 Tax=Pontimonas salivibrio TaxID=1159327 RepID=UPI000CF33CE3